MKKQLSRLIRYPSCPQYTIPINATISSTPTTTVSHPDNTLKSTALWGGTGWRELLVCLDVLFGLWKRVQGSGFQSGLLNLGYDTTGKYYDKVHSIQVSLANQENLKQTPKKHKRQTPKNTTDHLTAPSNHLSRHSKVRLNWLSQPCFYVFVRYSKAP